MNAAFTEFYVNNAIGATNTNAGSTTSAAAAYTSISGSWDGTNLFLPLDGSNPASTVSVGDWASVFLNAATNAVYIGRVTSVTNLVGGGIIVSTTAKSGTAPALSANGVTLKVGGCWNGPYGTVNFPFGVVGGNMTNASGDAVRVNIKSGTTYSVTANVTHNVAGPVIFQGYISTVGDAGKAVIDGGTSGASYNLLTISAASDIGLYDLKLQNNGASSTADLLAISGACSRLLVFRCVAANSTSRGFNHATSSGDALFIECEAFNCTNSGFRTTGLGIYVRCISHDNPTTGGHGFTVNSGNGFHDLFDSCIADTCGGSGFSISAVSASITLQNCDSYNSTVDGITVTTASSGNRIIIENCNLIKNGGWGVIGTGAGTLYGLLKNCGFGAGTQVNGSGTTTGLKGIVESGSITYGSNVTPWVDPANGDFRIDLAAAKGTGAGSFLQTQAGYSGTIAYPDVGAGQHKDGPKMYSTSQ